MKKITDERLKILQFKDFKIAFVIENLTILILLAYKVIKNPNNFSEILSFSNPLWFAFMIGIITFSIISQNVTAPMEDKPKASWVKVALILFLVILVSSSFFLAIIRPLNFLLSLICGSSLSLIIIAIYIYHNHFRL
jgi:O-antigen ligase